MVVFLRGFAEAFLLLLWCVFLVFCVGGFVYLGSYLGGDVGKWIAISLVGCTIYGACCWLNEKEKHDS